MMISFDRQNHNRKKSSQINEKSYNYNFFRHFWNTPYLYTELIHFYINYILQFKK